MPVMSFCIGFLVGMSLWTPFIVAARMEVSLARLEGRIILARNIRPDGCVR